MLSGNDDETYPLMKEGADGIISVASNIDPVSCSKLAHAMLEGKVEKDFFGTVSSPLEAVSRKAIVPTDEEVERNPRARSAKLRVAQKLEVE